MMQSVIVKQSFRDEPACSQRLAARRGKSASTLFAVQRCQGLFWRACQAQVFQYPRAAIRGSRYRGDSWDNFLHHIPNSSHGITSEDVANWAACCKQRLPRFDNFLTEVVVPYEWQCHLFSASSLATFSCTEAGGARREWGQRLKDKVFVTGIDNSCQKQLQSLHATFSSRAKESVNIGKAFFWHGCFFQQHPLGQYLLRS